MKCRFALAVIAVVLLASCAPASEPIKPEPIKPDRFKQLSGPLIDNVVYPEEFGVDVSDLSVDTSALLPQVSTDRLRAHVDAIDGPRPLASAAGVAAADYVDAQLAAFGYSVKHQSATSDATTMPNVFVDKPGTACPGKVFVVGAHFDSVSTAPGADDNASGVAGMLEAARVLKKTRLPIAVRFVGFSLEEAGLGGSTAMANSLFSAAADVVGMISLEMIGFTTTGKDPFIGAEQNSLFMVGNPASGYMTRVFGAAAFEYLPHLFAPALVVDPALVGDVMRSDHARFWSRGFQALMLTDLANFRNPNYHKATDTVDTLDFDFMARSTRAVIAGLVAYATLDANDDGTPDVCV